MALSQMAELKQLMVAQGDVPVDQIDSFFVRSELTAGIRPTYTLQPSWW